MLLCFHEVFLTFGTPANFDFTLEKVETVSISDVENHQLKFGFAHFKVKVNSNLSAVSVK